MPEDGYPLGRGFLPAARYDADTNQRTVINLAGTFVPPTDGGKFPGRARSHHALISGGAAGGHTVTNITVNDDLNEVLHFTAGALTADLTSEFTVSGAGMIANTNGTNTSSDQLLVGWTARGDYDLTGLTFPSGETTKAAMTLLAPASWASVDINVLAIAESFGSGNVVFRQSSGSTGTCTVTVAATYVGVLDFDNFAQLPLSRLGADESDTLEQGLSILAVSLTDGG